MLLVHLRDKDEYSGTIGGWSSKYGSFLKKIFVTFFWKVIHEYFLIKMNASKGYRLSLIPKESLFL